MFNFTKLRQLLAGLWLAVCVILLIYSLMAPYGSNQNMLFSLFMPAVFAVFIGLSLSPIYALALTSCASMLGVLGLKFWPIIPKVTSKKPEVIAATQTAFLNYQNLIWQYAIFVILALAILAAGVAFLWRSRQNRLNGAEQDLLEESFAASLKMQRINGGKLSIVALTMMAMFVAFGVIVNSLRVGVLSFGGFPIIFAGMLLGPVPGFIVGALTDLVSFIIRPHGGFNLVFTLSSALTGFLPIFVMQVIERQRELSKVKYTFIYILIGIAMGQLLTTVLFVPLARVLLYGQNTFVYYFVKALLRQLYHVPIYAYLIYEIMLRLKPKTEVVRK